MGRGSPARFIVLACPALFALLASAATAAAAPAAAGAVAVVAEPHAHVSIFWSLPFVLLLACIALMPFVHRHGWERHYPKVAVGLALLVAGYYFFVARRPWPWVESMQEYVSFIVLLASLYVVSGGILIRVGRKATPPANCALLLFGAVAANVFGTTGASMLLIRPYLRMNKGHVKPYHVVFFIFLVSNVGGAVTPIGDPPLFLGYLQGVPFWWVFERCRVIWGFTVAALLVVFWLIDTRDHGKFAAAGRADPEPGPAVHILGVQNFLFIGLILAAVFRDGVFEAAHELWHGIQGHHVPLASVGRVLFSRELIMLGAIAASLRLTSREIHDRNEFAYGPIKEVAVLFFGIFSTMVPAMQYLRNSAEAGRIELHTPGQYYFASGTLSSVLDNAPTYLTFLNMRLGSMSTDHAAGIDHTRRVLADMARRGTTDVDPDLPGDVKAAAAAAVRYHGRDVLAADLPPRELEIVYLIGNDRLAAFLVAISIGSVFFGACTYIGNGPNFMVKSIADSAGAPTPGFLGYVVYYVLPVLVPLYVVVWFVFLW